MFKQALACSLVFVISGSAYAAKPIKSVNTTFTVSLASTSFNSGTPTADTQQQKSGVITDSALGTLKIDVNNLVMISQIQTVDIDLLGCSASDLLFLPFRGRVSLVNTDTQSALLFGFGDAIDPLQSGLCLDTSTSPVTITPVNLDFQFQGGTGDFAVYQSGTLVTAAVDELAFPLATSIDTLGYVESSEYTLTLSP